MELEIPQKLAALEIKIQFIRDSDDETSIVVEKNVTRSHNKLIERKNIVAKWN